MNQFWKWFLLIYIFIALLFCCTNNKNNLELLTPRIFSPLQVDGSLTESVWKNVTFTYLKNNKTKEIISDPTFSTSIATCYDANNLYIAFICNDQDIYSSYLQRDEHLWTEECVEVFIDVDENPNTYVEIEVSPNNILFDSFIVDTANIDLIETPKFNLAGIQTAVKVEGTVNKHDDQDNKWTVEISIPFVELYDNFNETYLDNLEMKINFYRIDRDESGPQQYAWSATLGRFHKPSKFGKIKFINNKGSK